MGKKKSKRSEMKDKNTIETQKSLEVTEHIDNHDSKYENNVDSKVMKRPNEYNDSDSDVEKPKRQKKKKKLPIHSEDATGKKGQKSIRQMKREKFAQRQAEAQAATKDQLKSQCLNYLSQWKHDRLNWKFMKAKQVWLYKNKFSSQLIPDTVWPVFLEYFESATGNIKNMLLNDAEKVIKQLDDWTESQNKDSLNGNENEENDATGENDLQKPDNTVYNRARSLIQCLQE